MLKKLTVGELRKALQGVPDNLIVELASDSGVDQCGDGDVVIEKAWRVTFENYDRFWIYCNVREDEENWTMCKECALFDDCEEKESRDGCYFGEKG